MTDRNFRELQHDLEHAVSKLKGAKDPKLRRELLAEMRRLLAEADRLSGEHPE